jgi:hypothetical protein
MSDVLITPASGKIEFYDGSSNLDAKIELDGSGNLSITNPGGDISLGDTTADVFIGDGVNNIDIRFEQDGIITGETGVSLTMGESGSSLLLGTDLTLNGYDISGTGNITATSFTGDGSNLTGIGGGSWTKKTANYTASSGDQILTDTSGGAFTVTLPASPSAGDYIRLADADDWSTNNLTIARNGSTIEGDSDLIADLKGSSLELIYDGSTWEVFVSNVINDGDVLKASNDTSTTVLYPVMVNGAGSTTTPKVTTTKLSFNASTGQLTATDINLSSDINLKENIEEIKNSIDKLKKIRGVHFDWKDTSNSSIGVLAQDVEQVFPELVGEIDGIKSVKYNGLIGVLIDVVNKQQTQVETLFRMLEEKNNA